VAIANSGLIAHDERGVSFKWKDYRNKGRERQKTMTLDTGEFIRRFLIHVLPSGFHRIRHYGLFANTVRTDNLIKARKLLQCATVESVDEEVQAIEPASHCAFICPTCATPMIIIDVFSRSHAPRAPPEAIG